MHILLRLPHIPSGRTFKTVLIQNHTLRVKTGIVVSVSMMSPKTQMHTHRYLRAHLHTHTHMHTLMHTA